MRRQIGAGLALIAVSWPLYWTLVDGYLPVLFFALWLGYILIIDGVVGLRTGTSLLRRGPKAFAALFVGSAVFWWIYEYINYATRSWAYVLPDQPGQITLVVLKTLCFSTVLPALFETAELIDSLRPTRTRPADGHTDDRELSRPVVVSVAVVGVFSLIAVLLWPHEAYALMWLALFFILDPINAAAGSPSLLAQTRRGDWSGVVTMSIAGLVCGVVWEMWNSGTAAQWIYNVPGFNGAPHLFKMPLPGFLGYIPFAWSAFAFVHAFFQAARLPALP